MAQDSTTVGGAARPDVVTDDPPLDALAELDTLDARPTPEHVAVLEAVHEALAAELARSEE